MEWKLKTSLYKIRSKQTIQNVQKNYAKKRNHAIIKTKGGPEPPTNWTKWNMSRNHVQTFEKVFYSFYSDLPDVFILNFFNFILSKSLRELYDI